MLEDLIRHIRSEETQLQLGMAIGSTYSVASTACATIPLLHRWFQVKFWDSEICATESVRLARFSEGRDWGDETWQNVVS